MRADSNQKGNDGENFILARQWDLMRQALSVWPRRDAQLLEVNCGKGAFLPLIWQNGFDAVATEANPDLRAEAAALHIPGLELYAASADDLPFEDDSFDWVILHIAEKKNRTIQDGIAQALRVAKRGVMCAFWNSSSLPAIWSRLVRGKSKWLANAPSLWQICKTIDGLHTGPAAIFATLWLPECTWEGSGFFSRMNGWLPGAPFGAWCIVRIDFSSVHPVTPLPLRIGKKISRVQPAFEYVQKNCDNAPKNKTA